MTPTTIHYTDADTMRLHDLLTALGLSLHATGVGRGYYLERITDRQPVAMVDCGVKIRGALEALGLVTGRPVYEVAA